MLLQRKTLIETKNRTLKCLKWHYLTFQSMTNVSVLTEDGAVALFFRLNPGGFDSSRCPHPREFAIQGKKNSNARGVSPWKGGGNWALVELTDAYDSCFCLLLDTTSWIWGSCKILLCYLYSLICYRSISGGERSPTRAKRRSKPYMEKGWIIPRKPFKNWLACIGSVSALV